MQLVLKISDKDFHDPERLRIALVLFSYQTNKLANVSAGLNRSLETWGCGLEKLNPLTGSELEITSEAIDKATALLGHRVERSAGQGNQDPCDGDPGSGQPAAVDLSRRSCPDYGRDSVAGGGVQAPQQCS